MSDKKETITAMEEDDEDSDCLLIDEERTEPEQPVNANSCQLNDTASIANNEKTIQNNADTSPRTEPEQPVNSNNCQLNATSSIDNNEETIRINADTSPKKQNKSIGARLSCKDFSRIPFDNDSNLLTSDMASSECTSRHARLVDNTNTTGSTADPVQFRNKGTSNGFRPPANNFTDNVRHATDTFIQIPNPTETYYTGPQLPPNTINGNSDSKKGSVNTNRLDAIGNAGTSIPLNRNGYRIRSENRNIISMPAENMISIPAAQNLSHPGGPSTANGAEVDRLNGLIINNYLPPAMNINSYGPVSIHPRQSQKLYASDANRRQMYGHDLAAPSANYGPSIDRCQWVCCTGSCALNSATPTSVLPTNYILNMPSCSCPGSCNVHRSGPLYPSQPNIQAPPNFPTTALRNLYGQALNGNGAISREGVYRVGDPITYANYQQSTINTTRQHTVNSVPGPAMNQNPKRMAAANATRSCAKLNTNPINSGVINVAGFPAILASYQEATRCGNRSNMIANSEAFGNKNTVKNKLPTKTIKKTPKAKAKAVNNRRGRPPKSKNNHLQLINMNIATTLAHKQNDNLQQPTVEMRIPTEHGKIKQAYNRSDANIMQAPLSYELHLQNNMHNDIAQPQVDTGMQTIDHIIMDAIDMTMQNNVQQAENVTMHGNVQTSMSTETYKHDTMKRNFVSSAILSDLNKSRAFTSKTLTSGPVVSASAKAFELRAPESFTGVEIIRDKIESIDLTSDSDTLHDNMSMNINKVQTPNTQQAGMGINRKNAQIPILMEACLQQAEMSLNTDKTQININLLPKTQQANMNISSNRVQTIISKEVYTTQQDNMYTNVEPALASYINHCETSTSVPQISRALIQASNACELEMLISSAAKDITMKKDRAELESRTNISNAYTGTPLNRMSLTTNKAPGTIKSEHSKITNNKNSKMLTNAYQEDKKNTANQRKDIKKHIRQPAISDMIDITMPTNLNPVKMCMNTETVPTSISKEASVKPANMNNNVESLQSPAHLNKNNLGTKVTALWNSETTIQQSNTCVIKVPALSSTVTEDAGLCKDITELESRPNMALQTNIQQTRICVINVHPGFPAISPSHQEATRCGNSNNMITNSEAFGIKNTVKNTRPTKTIKKTPKSKPKAVNKTPRARAPTSKKTHLQLNNINIATTLAHKQNDNLQQPTVEMRIPTEHDEIKVPYNRSDAYIMQAPLSHELYLQNNLHNDIDQPQVKPSMQAIERIIMHAADMAMQKNVQQAENVTMYGKVQTSMSTETYKQDTLIRNVDSSVVLSNLNKSGASTSGTLTSGHVVSASAKGFELRTSAKGFELRAPASFTGVEVIRDKIESIDLASDSGMLHDSISMNVNKVQTPNTQQAGMNINGENAEIPIIMEACSQQAEMSLNTNKAQIDINLLPKTQQANMNMTSYRVQTINIKEVYTTQLDNMYTNVEPALASYMNSCETCVTQTSTTSNTCNLTYTTSSIESVTRNIGNADIASSFNNLNPRTGLMSSVPRSGIIYDTTQTQTNVHETDQTMDHISIDLLKSILDNVHRNATLQNTNLAITNISVHEPNTNQACNNNNHTNIITDQLPAVQEIKYHNEIYEGTETNKLEHATGTVSEGNIISHKSKSDEEINKLKITRQHLALLNMQKDPVEGESDPVEDNSQKNILDKYGSIISSVLERLNISQTSYEVSFSEQENRKSPNRLRSSADIKSLETRKRKIQNDREINKNSYLGSKKRVTDKPKIDTGSNQNIAIIDDDTINSNKELKTYSTYTRTHSDSTYVTKNHGIETATMCQSKINTGTNNNNKNNNKNCERKNFHDDTANRPDVKPKPKNSIREVKNKSSVSSILKALLLSGISVKSIKICGEHDKCESRRTNDKDEDNYKRGDDRKSISDGDDNGSDSNETNDKCESRRTNDKDEENCKRGDDRKSSSDSNDNGSDSIKADDEINKTDKTIENSFKTLKNNCNSNEKSDLPKVDISGKEDTSLKEPNNNIDHDRSDKSGTKKKKKKNNATVKEEYSYICHKCSMPFSYLSCYYSHMRHNHNIHDESIPEECVYKKCAICGLEMAWGKPYQYHIRTYHNNIFKIGAKDPNYKRPRQSTKKKEVPKDQHGTCSGLN